MKSPLTLPPEPAPDGIPSRVGAPAAIGNRSRIAELIRCWATALYAAVVCLPMLWAARPGTPLRVLGIAVFEYLARLQGRTLGSDRRLAIAQACDLGSLRDNYYDHQRLNVAEYRSLRSQLRNAVSQPGSSYYLRQLRQAERSRPILLAGFSGIGSAVAAYRTRVLDLMLQWMQTISSVRVEPVKYQSILSVLCLMQLADDVLDWRDDDMARRPSYVTAVLLDRPRSAVAAPLRAQADALLRCTVHAAQEDAGAVIFAVAGAVTWAFAVVLLKVRFPQ